MEKINRKKVNKNPQSEELVRKYVEKVLKFGQRTSKLNTQQKMELEVTKVCEGIISEDELFEYLIRVEELFR